MWELDYKESWVLKNWCFWTVVLEKTLESPLDCKEIQPVHPKGNQSWIFIGRTDAEAETPILCHLMWRADSFEKTLMLGKIEGGRRRGWQWWDGWMASLTQSTWVWVNSGSWWWTGKHGLLQSRVSQRVGHDWVTELNWTYSPSVRMTWETDFGLLIHPTWICAASATCRLFAGVGDKDEPSIAFAFRELLVYGRGDRYADRQL